MVKLTKTEMQVVVDYLLVQHDSLFECALSKDLPEDDREWCRRDEAIVRKFLLAAKEKGLNIDKALYPMNKKIAELSKEED